MLCAHKDTVKAVKAIKNIQFKNKNIHFKRDQKKTILCLIAASISTYCFAVGKISIIFALAVNALFVLLANTSIEIPEKYKKYKKYIMPALSLLTGIMVFLMSQVLMGTGLKNVNAAGFIMSVLICFFFVAVCCVIAGKPFTGAVTGSVILMLFASVDYAVYMFKGVELTPYDILAIRTALNVSEKYELPVTAGFVLAWTVMALFFVLLSSIGDIRIDIDRKKELRKTAPMLAVAAIAVLVLSGTTTSYRWGNGGSLYRGIYANFLLEVQESQVKKPSGYNAAELNDELSKYKDTKFVDKDAPNIIVIMNESYADLQDLPGHFRTNKKVMPFYDSLSEDVIKGTAYASVFGGGTSSSEYEFLTGNSMSFLPPGSIPYQQFVKEDTYSMVSVLKKNGYKCEAMHPYYSSGWNRDIAYPMLGFDETVFLDEFPEDGFMRHFITDRAMYETLIERFDKRDKRKPLFVFGVTMQNHGAYTDEVFDSYITITGHENDYPEAEQYLTLINLSDSALRYLIKHFRKEEDPTIIVFFGDHQPAISDDFYRFAEGKKGDEKSTLEERMQLFKVPFVIWANYDIEESLNEETSLNYLSEYVYEVAGIKTPYVEFLEDMSDTIPVLTAQGYYSASERTFKPTKEAEGKEKEALDLYSKTQYNGIFDSKNRIDMLKNN